MLWCTTIICVCFSTPIEKPQKHGFWTLQQCPMRGNKENSMGAKPGLYGGWAINSPFWPVKKAPVWLDVWEFALSWCTVIRLLLFVFRISAKILGKQIVVYHSKLTVLRCSSGTVATWPAFQKKLATICFEVIFQQTTFVGFGWDSKTHTVDYCFVSGLYAQMIRHPWRSYTY